VKNNHLKLKDQKSQNYGEKKMQTLSYDIEIKASKQKVWEILWQKESYQAWTNSFLIQRNPIGK
jgi:hypothetical protein